MFCGSKQPLPSLWYDLFFPFSCLIRPAGVIGGPILPLEQKRVPGTLMVLIFINFGNLTLTCVIMAFTKVSQVEFYKRKNRPPV